MIIFVKNSILHFDWLLSVPPDLLFYSVFVFFTVISLCLAFDVSADLTELGRTPVALICAGVKSILDIGLTLEYLVSFCGAK